jgi:Peptidase MA superfamily
MLDDYLMLRSDRIDVCYVEMDRRYAEDIAATLAKSIDTLVAYFDITEPLPRIRAILAPDRDTFDVLVADLLHVQIERPSDPRRVAQPQKTDIVFLSPSAYAAQSAYDYVHDDFLRMAHHELVHVIQEFLSPGIEESPLWWDEGLAVYLSNQWMFSGQFRFREPVLESIRSGETPNMSAIQADHALAYSFGWTIVRFIDQELGRDTIARIIKRMRDGDVFSLLGMDAGVLENRWHAWLLKGAGSRL